MNDPAIRPMDKRDKNGACKDWHRNSNLECFQANALLPLCREK